MSLLSFTVYWPSHTATYDSLLHGYNISLKEIDKKAHPFFEFYKVESLTELGKSWNLKQMDDHTF